MKTIIFTLNYRILIITKFSKFFFNKIFQPFFCYIVRYWKLEITCGAIIIREMFINILFGFFYIFLIGFIFITTYYYGIIYYILYCTICCCVFYYYYYFNKAYYYNVITVRRIIIIFRRLIYYCTINRGLQSKQNNL